MTEMEITNKEIADYYKGKDVTEADKLLLKTAQNNFEKGLKEAWKKELEFLEKVFGWSANAQNRIEELKKRLKK